MAPRGQAGRPIGRIDRRGSQSRNDGGDERKKESNQVLPDSPDANVATQRVAPRRDPPSFPVPHDEPNRKGDIIEPLSCSLDEYRSPPSIQIKGAQ